MISFQVARRVLATYNRRGLHHVEATWCTNAPYINNPEDSWYSVHSSSQKARPRPCFVLHSIFKYHLESNQQPERLNTTTHASSVCFRIISRCRSCISHTFISPPQCEVKNDNNSAYETTSTCIRHECNALALSLHNLHQPIHGRHWRPRNSSYWRRTQLVPFVSRLSKEHPTLSAGATDHFNASMNHEGDSSRDSLASHVCLNQGHAYIYRHHGSTQLCHISIKSSHWIILWQAPETVSFIVVWCGLDKGGSVSIFWWANYLFWEPHSNNTHHH